MNPSDFAPMNSLLIALSVWLSCGALVGFIAALALGIDRRAGVGVGVVGAVVGGALCSVFGLAGAGLSDAMTLPRLAGLLAVIVVAVVGAAGKNVIRRAHA